MIPADLSPLLFCSGGQHHQYIGLVVCYPLSCWGKIIQRAVQSVNRYNLDLKRLVYWVYSRIHHRARHGDRSVPQKAARLSLSTIYTRRPCHLVRPMGVLPGKSCYAREGLGSRGTAAQGSAQGL